MALNTQEAKAPSRHDWKIVDRDVKPQHNQPNGIKISSFVTDAPHFQKSHLEILIKDT